MLKKPKKQTVLLKAGLALILGISFTIPLGSVILDNKDGVPEVAYEERKSVPLGSFQVSVGQPFEESKDFLSIDGVVNSCLRKDTEIKWDIGHPKVFENVFSCIKERLEESKYRITIGKENTEDIFAALHDYYLHNGIWLLVRTLASNSGLQKKSLWKMPLEQQATLNFNLMNGKISSMGVPIYFLEKGGEEYYLPEATATSKGIFIYRRASERTPNNQDVANTVQDVCLHEGVHYWWLQQQPNNLMKEVDFDQMGLISKEEELRAYLVQMIYGHYPGAALLSILESPVSIHQYARAVITTYFSEQLKHKQEIVRLNGLSATEIRGIATDTYREYFKTSRSAPL